MGFENGSGLNIMEGYNGVKKVKNLCIHEFGHHLLGNNGMHGGLGFWAIMAGYGSRSNCANSFERVRLGWTNVINLDTLITDTISISDYVTTGECLKISLPNTQPKEYYLLENHQNISPFDITNGKGNGKGLYIIHQTGPYNSNLNLVSANGKWQWKFDHKIANPWGSGEIPVLERTTPDPINGYFDNQRIPYFDSTENKNESSLVYAYFDPFTKKDTINPLFSGIGKDQFNLENNNVISPWSNPRVLNSNHSVSNLAIEVLSDSNGIIKIKWRKGENLYNDFPPSKPLGLKAVITKEKNIKLKFFQDDEPNIKYYEIFRKARIDSEFKFIAKIKNENINKTETELSWIDKNFKNTSGLLLYKVRAVNDKNIKSVFSDECKFQIDENRSIKK